MSRRRVETMFLADSVGGVQPGKQEKLETQNALLAETLRKAEFRIAIRASTARILELASTTSSDPDSDPEAA